MGLKKVQNSKPAAVSSIKVHFFGSLSVLASHRHGDNIDQQPEARQVQTRIDRQCTFAVARSWVWRNVAKEMEFELLSLRSLVRTPRSENLYLQHKHFLLYNIRYRYMMSSFRTIRNCKIAMCLVERMERLADQ